ncbi:MAG: hypothetical protein AAF702_28165 [Chloroflexota bacterium]
MIVKNTTSKDTKQLKQLLNFAAKGVADKHVEVHVKNGSNGWRATAYDGIPNIANVSPKAQYLITMRMGNEVPDTSWTNVKRIKNLYPNGIPIDSWEDNFILYMAHEFRHIWQYQRTERTGKRGKGEYDAEKFAFKRLNEWREHTDRESVEPVKQANPFQECPLTPTDVSTNAIAPLLHDHVPALEISTRHISKGHKQLGEYTRVKWALMYYENEDDYYRMDSYRLGHDHKVIVKDYVEDKYDIWKVPQNGEVGLWYYVDTLEDLPREMVYQGEKIVPESPA